MASIVRLMCFPASDAAFVDLANEALGTARTPVAMAGALRRTYPLIAVRKQDPTASFGPGDERWYAYREGRVTSQSADPWWDDEGLARVGIDQTNAYTEANDHACRLFGVEPGSLVGRSWADFAAPGAAEDAEALRQSLQRHGHGDSTFRLTRPDGSNFDIDYHTIVYATGEQVLYETVMRERPGQPVRKPEPFTSMVESSLSAAPAI